MRILIHKWLTGDLGTAGNYQYQAIHLWSLAVIIAALAVLLVLSFRLRKEPKKLRTLLVGVAWFQLVFEAAWRLIYLLLKNSTLASLWPMYPCNLGGILLPLFVLFDCRRGKQMFYLFGFIGGCLTFALPQGIFSSDVLVFPILKSLLQHTGLLFIPLIELVGGSYRPSLKDLGWTILGALIHVANCEGINRLLGLTGDYMFFRGDLPFVIPGVPQFITMSVFGLIVLSLLSFLCNVRASVQWIRGNIHK